MLTSRCVTGLLIAAAALAACDRDAEEVTEERVRAIKPYFVVEPAGGDVRRYSGTIVAANTSALSFPVAGTVATVEANQGDRVSAGQLLATLDSAPFDLDVQAAQSQAATAQAQYNNARVELDRQQQLFDRGWVARAALDQAVAAFDASQGDLNLAQSRVGIAERDMANAGLTAPFDGVIALRDVDPFIEVTRGQVVFRLDSEDALEVDLSIPDTAVGRISIGLPVVIDTLTDSGCGCTGRVIEIGTTAGSANTVPVTAAILDRPSGILPGMGVQATVILSGDTATHGLLVPVVAIAPGDDNTRGFVFKFDPDAGVVRKTAVAGDGIVSGNLISITEGLDSGDIVAAAGVSFLRDGQPVTLLGQ